MVGTLQRSVRLVNAAVNLTSTNLTTVYTVPAKTTAIVREMFIANYDSSARNLNIQWTDTSATATATTTSTSTTNTGGDDIVGFQGQRGFENVPYDVVVVETVVEVENVVEVVQEVVQEIEEIVEETVVVETSEVIPASTSTGTVTGTATSN